MLFRSRKIALLIAFAAVSCGNQDSTDPKVPGSMPRVKDDRQKPVTTRDAKLQALVDGATADLVTRLASRSVRSEDVEVLEARHVTWRSSAVGCPMPDRGYLMVLTPGALIRLRVGDEVFQYHSTPRGPAFLCEPPGTIETPAPGDPSYDTR
ncbi:MAG: hypothetical protein R3288_10920 [Woeseiaceae bacterium]|nr:hypothetical protein [Woeseiaceae bacterium]